jgi:flagellar motor switch protein FliM
MEPVLTQEELEAIYAAMKGDDLPSASIDDVSLSAGQEFIRRSESKWNEAMKAMSSSVESILTGALGKRIGIRLHPAEAWLDDEMDVGDSGPSFLNDDSAVMTVTKIGETFVVVGVDLELARRVIERRTGAKPSKDSNSKERGLTSLERKLLNDLIRDLANVAAKATPMPGEAVVSSMDSSDMWTRRKKGELWVMSGIGIQEMSGKGLRLFGPSSLFMPRPMNLKNTISGHLESATIVLAAELGKFRMNVQNLWQLRPGTVIPMGTTVGDPLLLTIGGVPKLLGDPMAQRGNVAVKIKKRIEKGVRR